jgi:hypothetical protein
VISVELIQRSLAVTIAGYHVEPVHESDFSSRTLLSAGRAI